MDSDSVFFDAASQQSGAAALPANSCGALVFGAEARARDDLFVAAPLSHLVGPNDPRYPLDADVVSLRFDFDTLLEHLKQPPVHWWPLMNAAHPAGRKPIIHIAAREFGSLAKGISKLSRAFPQIQFLIDPFEPGKVSSWRAGVCLAEADNVWLTLRGLYAAEAQWPARAEREALYFSIGEVGAGKLLFGSGMSVDALNAQPTSPAEWLESIQFLDAAQRRLILRENAETLFSTVRPVRENVDIL